MSKERSLLNPTGYRMPAEWEPHEATWVAWPHKEESWPGRFDRIPPIWVEMIRALRLHEKVNICVNDEATEEAVRSLLRGHMGNVFLHRIPTNDAWVRDHGPIFVKGEKGLAVVDWVFNSWGKKYGPWDLDDVVPQKIARHLDLPCLEPGIVLEGGSIDINGRGTLLTTEQCLLNRNRNPHLTKKEIEGYLKDYLGGTHILWLGDGIAGDDTDGHVDDIARFVGPATVVATLEEDPADENYKLLQDNLMRLKSMTDQDGTPLDVVPIPMPGPVFYEGQRLPASYANFYIGNGVVLVPTYRHRNDRRALEILKELFSKRNVIGIDATELIWGLGAFHCVTQQQPAGIS